MNPKKISIKVWICSRCKRSHGSDSCAQINAANCCACQGCARTGPLLNGGPVCSVCWYRENEQQARRQLDRARRIHEDAVKSLEEETRRVAAEDAKKFQARTAKKTEKNTGKRNTSP